MKIIGLFLSAIGIVVFIIGLIMLANPITWDGSFIVMLLGAILIFLGDCMKG